MNQNKKPIGPSPLRGIVFYFILLTMLYFAVSSLYNKADTVVITYSDIVGFFDKEEVKNFTVDERNIIHIVFKDTTKADVTYKLPSLNLFLYSVPVERLDELTATGGLASYDFAPPYETPFWMTMLPYLLLFVGFGVLWYYLMNQQGGAGGGKVMNFGKARTKVASDEKRKVTFDDVAGAEEEKLELFEIVDFLKEPRKYLEIGARIPKGILLYGPPGTGKTLLARAVSGEAGVPFYSISGSDFVEMFVGVGASRVRDLFDQAKKTAPCIVFIDEIDAVGRHRGAGLGGGHDEREQTLNQLLVEMDGFGKNEGVIIIAATNRPDILDPALLRPGRFDRQIMVNAPDQKGREEILKVHARGKPFEEDVKLGVIAKTTPGFTGADLENLLNESALLAARRNGKKISMEDVEEATIKVIAGPEKRSRTISEKERKLTAYHEAGHAIVTRALETQNPVHQISIIPRGMAGGYTLSLPTEDKYYSSREEMREEIVTLLGGRAAERLCLTDISTGASNDIERATTIARKMVTVYGMSDELGPIVYGSGSSEVFLGRDFAQPKNYSEDVSSQIDREIKRIIDDCYRRAMEILGSQRDILDKLAALLMEKEKIGAVEFEALFPQKQKKEELFPHDSETQSGEETVVKE